LDRLAGAKIFTQLDLKDAYHRIRIKKGDEWKTAFRIRPEGIGMEQSRVDTIESWLEPTSVRDVQVFVGFANFYRRFIKGFSKIVAPLTDLTKTPKSRKKAKRRDPRTRSESPPTRRGRQAGEVPAFAITQEARKAFKELKTVFMTSPMLRHYDPARRIRIEPDASGFAIAAILAQLHDDGQ
jgi:hypothetical protein